MRNQLIQDINAYITHLNSKGLYVTVHGKGISGLLEHNIHKNPFCTLVKTDSAAWDKCVQCQQKVFSAYQKDCLFGMCHAGVEEYVFFVNEKTFVSVSGYGIHKEKAFERIEHLAQEFYLDKTELFHVYENCLKHSEESPNELDTRIKPLCHMLYLLQLFLGDVSEAGSPNTMYDSILSFVQFRYMYPITVKDIAQACSCSESTVHHLFKQYSGMSVKKYIEKLRIEQARNLLTTSRLPISTIALMCGFTNINYFPTAFRKNTGMNPTEYRERS